MTVFEILNFNRELINRLTQIGFKPEDCRYIDLYSDFEAMEIMAIRLLISCLFLQINMM